MKGVGEDHADHHVVTLRQPELWRTCITCKPDLIGLTLPRSVSPVHSGEKPERMGHPEVTIVTLRLFVAVGGRGGVCGVAQTFPQTKQSPSVAPHIVGTAGWPRRQAGTPGSPTRTYRACATRGRATRPAPSCCRPQNQRFMIAGGGDADQNLPPTDKVGIIGLKASAATSQPAADLPGPGWLYLTMTTLPDRTVLASNGPTGQAFPITTTGAVVSASLTSPARPRTRRTPTHGSLICPSTGAQPPTRGCGAGDRRVADLKPERGNRT